MIHQTVQIAGDTCFILTVETEDDYPAVREFVASKLILAYDTEATGLNPYERGWELRLFQVGDGVFAFNIPAIHPDLIRWVCEQNMMWIAHNAPHDCASVNAFLKQDMGMLPRCVDTKIYSHLLDSRSENDGGVGHKLKENIAVTYIDRNADQGKKELNEAFDEIRVDVPGEFYKSGPKKGEQKTRKILRLEGWRHIDQMELRYLRYSGTDPLLTYRAWQILSKKLGPHPLIAFEHELQLVAAEMEARGMLLDVQYAETMSQAYADGIESGLEVLKGMGLDNPNSPIQVVAALQSHGAELTKLTDAGKLSADKDVLKKLTRAGGAVGKLAQQIKIVKQMSKRKAAYTDAMLESRDRRDRVHASINTLAARTARMSVSRPPLQQLPSTNGEIPEDVD